MEALDGHWDQFLTMNQSMFIHFLGPRCINKLVFLIFLSSQPALPIKENIVSTHSALN
jgi:hypothetical protein